jgi:hypothetical protein
MKDVFLFSTHIRRTASLGSRFLFNSIHFPFFLLFFLLFLKNPVHCVLAAPQQNNVVNNNNEMLHYHEHTCLDEADVNRIVKRYVDARFAWNNLADLINELAKSQHIEKEVKAIVRTAVPDAANLYLMQHGPAQVSQLVQTSLRSQLPMLWAADPQVQQSLQEHRAALKKDLERMERDTKAAIASQEDKVQAKLDSQLHIVSQSIAAEGQQAVDRVLKDSKNQAIFESYRRELERQHRDELARLRSDHVAKLSEAQQLHRQHTEELDERYKQLIEKQRKQYERSEWNHLLFTGASTTFIFLGACWFVASTTKK